MGSQGSGTISCLPDFTVWERGEGEYHQRTDGRAIMCI